MDNFDSINFSYPLQDELQQEMFEGRFKNWSISMGLRVIIILDMTLWYFFSLVAMSPYEEFNPHKNKTSTYRILPFDTYFPFDISLSDGYFWYAFVLQCLVESMPAYMYMSKKTEVF